MALLRLNFLLAAAKSPARPSSSVSRARFQLAPDARASQLVSLSTRRAARTGPSLCPGSRISHVPRAPSAMADAARRSALSFPCHARPTLLPRPAFVAAAHLPLLGTEPVCRGRGSPRCAGCSLYSVSISRGKLSVRRHCSVARQADCVSCVAHLSSSPTCHSSSHYVRQYRRSTVSSFTVSSVNIFA